MRILIVEDEPSLREGLVDLLEHEGHCVEAVGDGELAVRVGTRGDHDLVLLDLMLPKLDGLEVCRRLREVKPKLGILMLTASGGEADKVAGLKRGADDYVTKPFGTQELLARINSLGRRLAVEASPERLEIDGAQFDLGRCEFRRDDRSETLTAREANLIRFVHRHRQRAVSRSELLEEVWKAPGDLQTRTVDMCVANLRQKVERDPRVPAIIVTVKGVGYAWGDQS